jgi:hypothetical protein
VVEPASASAPRVPWWRSRHVPALAALAVVALAAFSNSFSAGFVLDSRPILLQDPRIRQFTADNLLHIWQHSYWWPTGEAGLYRPVTTLSYLFNYAVLGNGNDATGYHWVNFLLHLLNIGLAYVLAMRLLRRFWPSVLLAGVWAVHPLLTEAVTNMVGRADLLAAASVLGGLWVYLRSTEVSGGRRLAWLAALAVVGAAGFLAKESAVILGGVIALWELTWWKERRQSRGLVLAALALLAPLELMLYQRSAVMASSAKASFPFTDNPIVGASFWPAKLTAIKVLAQYLGLTFWPAHLSADYSYSQIPIASGTAGDWVAWIVMTAVAAGVALLYRVHREAFFLACFAFVTLLPGSNLLFATGTVMAERFMYLPALGVLGCVVIGLYALGERIGSGKLAPAVLALIGIAFGIRTWARNADWHDDLSLATADVASAPRSFKTHKFLAVVLMQSDAGDRELDRELEEARRSMALVDGLPDDRNDQSIYRLACELYLKKGDGVRALDQATGMDAYRHALSAIQRAIAITLAVTRDAGDPGKAPPPFGNAECGRLLAQVYERLGDSAKAQETAIEARRLDPLNPATYRQLADAFLVGDQAEDAALALMEGMIVTQDMGIRHDLVKLYQERVDPKGCSIVPGPNGPALNPSCPMIHEHLCAIAADSIKVRVFTGRRDIAEQLKRSFLHDYACPSGPIDQALPGKPGS